MKLRTFFTNLKGGPARIAGLYLLMGVLWILFSDIIAAEIAPDQVALTKISIYKGWGYVILTAGLLYWLIQRYARRLNKNDELLQLAGEMMCVGGWEFDAATFEGTWTDEVARIHDLDPGAPTNVERGISFYLPESKKKIQEAIIEAVEYGKPYDLELEMLTAKGTHKWVRTIARPVMENGRAIRVRGIFQDITERKMIEASLKENEERFRSLYENATIGIYRTTPDGHILLCNPALLDMLGYRSLGELTQRNLETDGYEPGYERSEFRQKIENQGEVRGFESAWTRQDGSTVYVRESAKAIRDADGKVVYYEGTVEDITERKNYEKALQLENERFMRFIDSNIVGIVIADTVGNVLMANDYYLNILGVTRQDFLEGKVQWTRFTLPEWLPADEKAIQELREHGVCEPYEKEYERADGTRVPVYIANAMLPGPGEQVAAFILDISKRKRAEKEIEYLARFPLENPNPIMRVTDEGQLIYANLPSRPLQDLWGCEINDFLPDDWRKTIAELVVSQLKKSRDLQCDDRVYSIMIVPVQGAGYVNLYAREITERKRAEDALRASEEKLKTLFEILPVGVSILDKDRKIVFQNQALERILDIRKEKLMLGDYRYRKYFRSDGTPMPGNEFASSLAVTEKRAVHHVETGVEKEDGSIIWTSISATPVDLPDWSVVVVTSDITDLKQVVEDLERSNVELEQFAYVASHDLQEPLRAIAGMVQLLQKHYHGKLDEQADEYIEFTVEAADRMRKLINDLLTYSRVDRFGNHFVETDIEKVLETALTNLRVAVEESQATVTHDPLPALMIIDATQITQVFQNLLGNAIKFRGERPLQIHIGAQEVDNAWRFEIRDNGIGIEPQYFERIFGVFQRLHTRREYPGTGIGLSLCKKIVERHGGSIWVESEIGQGASFYFTLPNRRRNGEH
jgi:PAS domain S-box-containing protein